LGAGKICESGFFCYPRATVGAKEEIASATTKANWFKLEQAQTAKQKLIHLLLCDGAGP